MAIGMLAGFFACSAIELLKGVIAKRRCKRAVPPKEEQGFDPELSLESWLSILRAQI